MRYVEVTDRDGRLDYEPVALTRQENLHPRMGDTLAQGVRHFDDCAYLRAALRNHLATNPGALVFSHLSIVWDRIDVRPHSPDCMVIFGVTNPDRQWTGFSVRQEGVRPSLIIEITSPRTRSTDLVIKLRQYYRLLVPFYAIVDQTSGHQESPRLLRVLGYRLGRRAYEPLPLNDQGWLWLEPVGLWLGVENERTCLYRPAGEPLLTYGEMKQARDSEAQARAEAEAARIAAENRVRQLEEELRHRNGS
jgi:colicin import membrane protein